MKVIGRFVLCVGLLLTAVSCLDDPDMIKWRNANAEFLSTLKDSTDIYPLEKNDSLLYTQRGGEYVPSAATGIYYKVLQEGNGPVPIMGQSVRLNYRGWLYDGTLFDEGSISPKVGSNTIDGFFEVLQRMPIGSVWRVYIPYYMAYGNSDYNYTTPIIPAYSNLIFEIELLGFKN